MKPKNHRIFFEGIAEDAGVHQELVDSLISFYFARVRKNLSELEHPRIHVAGLGTFKLRKWKLEQNIKRNKDILGNLEKMTFKGYGKAIPVKEKLKNMERALVMLDKMQTEKKAFKK